jgi:membrane fusion protein (multidrug efflux system)
MQAKAQLARAKADLAQAREKTVVDTAEANVGIALAQLNKTDQDVRRLKPLAEQRAVPQQDYDNALAAQQAARADIEGKKASLNTAKVNQTAAIQLAQASVEAANAIIRQAELNVEYCTITSPISGIAGTRQVAPGNLVGNGEATLLTTVSNVNPVRVYISISESDYLMYQRLKSQGKMKGGVGELQLILADGSLFPERGRIIIADRAVDTKTGTFSLLVPQKAVTEMQSARVVYVVGNDNKVALRTVTLGDRVDQDYIVTEGVKAGERIIIEGLQKARPGAIVNPTTAPATAERTSAKKVE